MNPIRQKRGWPKFSRQSPSRPNSVHKSGVTSLESPLQFLCDSRLKRILFGWLNDMPGRNRCWGLFSAIESNTHGESPAGLGRIRQKTESAFPKHSLDCQLFPRGLWKQEMRKGTERSQI